MAKHLHADIAPKIRSMICNRVPRSRTHQVVSELFSGFSRPTDLV